MKTALLLLLGASSSYAVCTITVTSPTAAQSISGFAGAGNPTPFTFTASLSGCPTVQKVGYAVDGYSLYNPGIDGAPLGSTYANGSPRAAVIGRGYSITPPYSVPFNTFWFGNSTAHTVIATAYDVNNAVLATSSAVTFTIANTWPVACSDSSAPASSMTFGSVSSGILPVTWTVTGSCATDSKAPQPQIFVDGVNQTLDGSFTSTNATETFNLDETRWLNGTHIICWGWQDATNKTTYSGSVVVDSAGEQCDPVTFSNGAVAMEVHNKASDIFLGDNGSPMWNGNTFTLSPTVLNTDGSAGSATYDYLIINPGGYPAIASVNSSGLVTAMASPNCGPGTGYGCSTQVATMAEARTATDLSSYMGTGQFWSISTGVYMHVGDLVRVTGGTNCTPGVYYINAIDLRVPVFTFTNGSGGAVNPGTSCTAGSFATGPTRLATVFNSQADVMATLGSDGVAHATYSPNSIYMHETFASGGITSGDTAAAAQRPVTYNWAGGGTGPLAELDAGGLNTVELETLPETCSDYSADTLSAFTSTVTGWIDGTLTGLSGLKHFKYAYGTGDNMLAAPQSIWPCIYSLPLASGWTGTSPMQVILAAFAASGYTALGITGPDENIGTMTVRPLSGPTTPAGANSWLGSGGITSNGTTCTVTGTNMYVNGSDQFIIHGSSSSAINTAPGGSGYTASAAVFAASSFTFPCTWASGTYNDAGLTIEQNAAAGYTLGSNTGYIGYDAIAKYIVQADAYGAAGTRTPVAFSQAADNPCVSRQNWMGNGVDGPIDGISQVSEYVDFYPDYSEITSFLTSRSPANWNVALAYSPGVFIRQNFGCYNPSLPLVTLTALTETQAGNQGYTAALASGTSINGSIMTFATGHNLVNVVPGDTRVQVTGNSNSALNTNYYVLSILSPTQLSVAWGQANFAASATNCTATFSPSGFVENSVSVGAQTSVGINKLFPGNGLLYGQTWSLSAADVNLPKHAGESFTFSACSAGTNPTDFNGITGVYAPTNSNVAGYTADGVWWQTPIGSGTGGTAVIVPDNSSNCGRAACGRPGTTNTAGSESDPVFLYAAYRESMIAGAVGFRGYKLPGPQGYGYQSGYGYIGAGQAGSATFYGGIRTGSLSNAFFCAYHFENAGNVSCFEATSLAAKHLTHWQKYTLQPRWNSPDFGPTLDCTARGYSGNGNGSSLTCVNATNGTVTRTIAFPSNLIASGQSIIEDIAGYDGYHVLTVLSSGTTSASVTLAEGQAVDFIFPTTFAGSILQPSISFRLADIPNATGVTIRYGDSLYNFDLPIGNTVNCGSTSPCTLPIDANEGTIYYRLNYYNSSGVVIARGDIQH